MFKNPVVAWLVAIIAIAAALGGWYRAHQYQGRTAAAETKLQNEELLRTVSNSMEPATFIGLDGDTLHYRIPHQFELDDRPYMGEVDATASVSQDTTVLGSQQSRDINALLALPSGSPIRIHTISGDNGIPFITVVLILP